MIDTSTRSSTRPKSATDALKIPPHSNEAEQSVIGGLMLENHSWDRVVEIVSEIDFYRQEHRLLFRAMAEMAKSDRPFDVLTLAEHLKQHGVLADAGGEVYLFELARNTPTAANIVAYAEIVRERSVLRQLIGWGMTLLKQLFRPEGRSSQDLIDEAERKVFQISETTHRGAGPQRIDSLVAMAVDRIDTLFKSPDAITGLSTGFNDLDDLTAGLQNSDLVIIAGRPSMGKTAFALNIGEHAAIRGKKPVLVFSMEMPGDILAMRLISSLGRIDQQSVRTGKLNEDDWPRVASAVSLLSEAKLFIDDTAALTPTEVRARARRLAKQEGGLGLIIIDYLQLMQVPGFKENRTGEISEISRSLKALAKELNVPVIALSQLNRGLEQRHDRRPVMSDLRESGAIEQDADVIAFIYRDEVYNENSADKGTAEIIIAKQRNGPIGKVRLAFLGKYTRFENLRVQPTGKKGFKHAPRTNDARHPCFAA